MLTDGSLNSISRETLRKKKEKQSRYLIPPADVDLPDDSDLVHVEEDPVSSSSSSLYLVGAKCHQAARPEGVAHQEAAHDGHQDGGQVVLVASPPTPPSLAAKEENERKIKDCKM